MYKILYIIFIKQLSKLLMNLKYIIIFFFVYFITFIKLKEKAFTRKFYIIPFETEPYEFENFFYPLNNNNFSCIFLIIMNKYN